MKSDKLVADLVKDLKPVKRLPSIGARILVWLASSAAIAVLEFFVVARLRPEAMEMIEKNPRFAVETILIFLSPVLAAVGAIFMSVPGNEKKRWLMWAALLCFLFFVGMTVYDFWDPIYESSLYHVRGRCPMDVPLFGLVPLAALFYLVRQAAPLNWRWLSILITLGAFAPMAAMMQLTCMGGAAHNLIGHILPVFIMGCVVLLLGQKYLRK